MPGMSWRWADGWDAGRKWDDRSSGQDTGDVRSSGDETGGRWPWPEGWRSHRGTVAADAGVGRSSGDETGGRWSWQHSGWRDWSTEHGPSDAGAAVAEGMQGSRQGGEPQSAATLADAAQQAATLAAALADGQLASAGPSQGRSPSPGASVPKQGAPAPAVAVPAARGAGASGLNPAPPPKAATAAPPQAPPEAVAQHARRLRQGTGVLQTLGGPLGPAPVVGPLVAPLLRSRMVYSMEYFRLWQPNWHGCYKQHNAYLKFRVQQCENEQDPLNSDIFECTAAPEEIPMIVKDKARPMAWDWDWQNMVQWSWLEMIAQLDDDSMAFVVTGQDGRSGGVVSCRVCPCPGSYDHKRHHKKASEGNRHQTVRLPRWDFLVMRDDDTGVRLHPDWNSPQFKFYPELPDVAPVQIPRGGLGRSEGRGTYVRYRSVGAAGDLRFDARKGQGLPPFRAAAVSRSSAQAGTPQ